jgi:guanine deaminase
VRVDVVPSTVVHASFLDQAIAEAARGVAAGDGGPFGALVVRDGRVLGRDHNRVTSGRDPTAHAEVLAIRAACRVEDDYALRGAVLYASCEPCPMCLAAAYWARVDHVYYAATRDSAAAAGFDDTRLYVELSKPPDERQLPITRLTRDAEERPFDAWRALPTRVPY